MHARRFQKLLLNLILLLATTITLFAQATAPAAIGSELSAKDRKEVFEYVWTTVNEKYYDHKMNGVAWKEVRAHYRNRVELVKDDNEFYQLLQMMVGELRDAHTRIRDPYKRYLFDRLEAVTPGISIGEVEGQNVIVSVIPNSEAEKLGVKPGMIVRAIDKKSIDEKIVELRSILGESSSPRATKMLVYANLLDGEEGSEVTLWLENPNDARQTFEVKLKRQIYSTAVQVVSKRLSSGLGYIKLNRWKSPGHEQFRNELLALKNASGLIIDLRGNGGGSPSEVLEIGSYFFGNPVPFGKFIRRSGRPNELAAGRVGGQLYSGLVVIIVNESSGSGSELFTGVMQEIGRAWVVGRQSCGCLLAATRKKLKGGGELDVSEFGYLTPRERRLEGIGVIPDRAVPLTLDDLRQKRDAALEEAERFLKQQLQPVVESK